MCIYCGSNEGSDPAYRLAAAALTRALVSRGAGIVYGGGSRGLMGEVANIALEARVPLVGVVPSRFRKDRSDPPPGADYRFTDTMQERKALMRDLSDGFVALPGGIGTIDEISETLMLRSLRFHSKPLALLDVQGFFSHFVSMLRDARDKGFLKAELLESLIVSQDPEAVAASLIEAIAADRAGH